MKKIPKIKNKFPLLNGLFSKFNYQFLDFTSSQLDIIFLSKCGERLCSPIVDIISEEVNLEYLTSEQLIALASIILNIYKNKWDKLLSLYDLEYSPINSYYDTLVENVNDVTQEIIDRDSTDNITNSRLTTTSEDSSSTMEHSANNTNSTESSRNDNFTSNYSRDLDESITRTDNLTSLAVNSGTDTTTRTDNLSSSTTEANSNISSSAIDNEFAGFNSVDRVDTTASNNTSQSTDNNTSSVTDTGTQTIAEQKNTSLTTTNTGTQTNVNDTIISDVTTNVDNQTSSIDSTLESTSTNTNTIENSSTVNDSFTSRDVLVFDETKDGTLERERSLSHSGNIGNISPQDLISQEIELWRWNFIDEVMEDVKQFLTIPLYY